MTNKTIIFGAPKTFTLSDEIVKNLQLLGFNVIDVSFPYEYKYKNLGQKILNFVYKNINGNLEYKNNLRFAPYRKDFTEKINQLPQKADYLLLIRPDIFPEDFVKLAVSHSEKSIAYQWDGMHIFPDIQRYRNFFDRFFVFDPNDVSLENGLLPTTNFFFDNDICHENLETKKNLYFVGSYFKDRMQPIENISKIIAKTDFKNEIYIKTNKKWVIQQYKDLDITFLQQNMSFSENLKKMKEASVLLDFINGKHHGLSFRTFEAIGYRKKLITNNIEVKKYDFYHPNNFFVWENDNFEDLENFLNLPYVDLPENVWKKYSFSNWIKYILDIVPHQKIGLPK